jgi:hypothetical protein
MSAPATPRNSRPPVAGARGSGLPVLARDHAGGGHEARAVGSGQQPELPPDDLPHAGEPVGGERGPRGEAVSPLRHEPVADRRDGPEHSLKHRP